MTGSIRGVKMRHLGLVTKVSNRWRRSIWQRWCQDGTQRDLSTGPPHRPPCATVGEKLDEVVERLKSVEVKLDRLDKTLEE